MLSTQLSFLSGPDISILAPKRPPSDPRSSAGKKRKPGEDKRPAGRILIVEDDWFAGIDMQAALEDAGYEVSGPVMSADEAVAAAQKDEPDLVIMDIRLVGNRNGVDAALEIARRFDIRSLFVTAYVDPALTARAEAARPFGWLTKPIPGDALVTAVRRALK